MFWQVGKWKLLFFTRWGQEHPAIMMKPSVVGMRINSAKKLPLKKLVRIRVPRETWGGDHPLMLLGEVVWSEPSDATARTDHGLKLRKRALDQRTWESFILEKLRGQQRDPRILDFHG